MSNTARTSEVLRLITWLDVQILLFGVIFIYLIIYLFIFNALTFVHYSGAGLAVGPGGFEGCGTLGQ